MSIFETYSKRQKGQNDLLIYDKIENKLKAQIFHIWQDFFTYNKFPDNLSSQAQHAIFNTICKEEGKKSLYFNGFSIDNDPSYQVENYFNNLEDVNKILDVIEITFFFISQVYNYAINRYPGFKPIYSASSAIQELNIRFKENGVGYEYVNNVIIRIDDELLHLETVQPTLHLLSEEDYKNVNEEYMNAHEHFKYERNKECLNDCLKAFETTMKIICHKNNWNINENDTAKSLINALIINNFLPSYHQNQISAIRQQLESTIPTMRNKNSGHGQGVNAIFVPDSLARFMLYTTGATIRLLIELQNEREITV